MASRKQFDYWDGVTKGNGEEAVCKVQVLDFTHPAGGLPVYAQHQVINIARNLPDGLYDLEAHGGKRQVRHAGELWTAA